MSKVTIIVPVFNVAPYLQMCLESIFNQKYEDLEIIIVDDGSTDESATIIKKLIQRKKNCKYIYQENQGLSAARNTGLQYATGEYVCFVDSDDWIEEGYVQQMLDVLLKEGADVCICGYYRRTEDKIYSNILPKYYVYDLNDPKKFLQTYYDIFIEEKYGIIAWNKLYKRNLIINNNLVFEKNVEIYAEDLLFNTKFLLSGKRIVAVNRVLYNYRMREGSITRNEKPNLAQRLAELVTRVSTIAYKRLNGHAEQLISLLTYEMLNNIAIDAYETCNSFKSIYQGINNFCKIKSDSFKLLSDFNKYYTLRQKRNRLIFQYFLGLIARTKNIRLISIMYYLKIKLISIRRLKCNSTN